MSALRGRSAAALAPIPLQKLDSTPARFAVDLKRLVRRRRWRPSFVLVTYVAPAEHGRTCGRARGWFRYIMARWFRSMIDEGNGGEGGGGGRRTSLREVALCYLMRYVITLNHAVVHIVQ